MSTWGSDTFVEVDGADENETDIVTYFIFHSSGSAEMWSEGYDDLTGMSIMAVGDVEFGAGDDDGDGTAETPYVRQATYLNDEAGNFYRTTIELKGADDRWSRMNVYRYRDASGNERFTPLSAAKAATVVSGWYSAERIDYDTYDAMGIFADAIGRWSGETSTLACTAITKRSTSTGTRRRRTILRRNSHHEVRLKARGTRSIQFTSISKTEFIGFPEPQFQMSRTQRYHRYPALQGYVSFPFEEGHTSEYAMERIDAVFSYEFDYTSSNVTAGDTLVVVIEFIFELDTSLTEEQQYEIYESVSFTANPFF